jgi:DNA polymerase-3 subunit epsilon
LSRQLALPSGQSGIGFGSAAESVETTVVLLERVIDAARPRVQVSDVEAAAHEMRLAALRKKAGRAVWDQAVEAIEAEPAIA